MPSLTLRSEPGRAFSSSLNSARVNACHRNFCRAMATAAQLRLFFNVPAQDSKEVEERRVQQRLKQRLVQLQQERAQAPNKKHNGPGHDWTPAKKEEAAKMLLNMNYAACKLHYKDACPKETTLRGWAAKVLLGGAPARPGRPSILSKEEELTLVKTVKEMRDDGACIDRETLQILGRVQGCLKLVCRKSVALFKARILMMSEGP